MNEEELAAYNRQLCRPADSTPNVYLTAREMKAVSMRLSDANYRDIATELGLPSGTRAKQIVMKARGKIITAYVALLGIAIDAHNDSPQAHPDVANSGEHLLRGDRR